MHRVAATNCYPSPARRAATAHATKVHTGDAVNVPPKTKSDAPLSEHRFRLYYRPLFVTVWKREIFFTYLPACGLSRLGSLASKLLISNKIVAFWRPPQRSKMCFIEAAL